MKADKIKGCYFIPAIVKLGVQRLKCKRHGICEIKIVNEFDFLTNPLFGAAHAYLSINEQDVLAIYFLMSSMHRDTQKKHFHNNVFTVEDDYLFRLELKAKYHMYRIVSGNYNVYSLDDFQVVDFNQEALEFYENQHIVHGFVGLSKPLPLENWLG